MVPAHRLFICGVACLQPFFWDNYSSSSPRGRNDLVNKVLANIVVVQESNATFNIYQICLIFADYAILSELPICWQIQIFVVETHGF